MRALLVLLLCPAYLLAAWPENPALADLEKAIQKQGTKSVVRELMVQVDSHKGPNPWVWIGDNVAKGSPEWLNLAAQFEPFVDGIYGEILAGAAADALRKNPAGVLKLLEVQGRWGLNIDQ